MPPGNSATRGAALPSRGSRDTALVTRSAETIQFEDAVQLPAETGGAGSQENGILKPLSEQFPGEIAGAHYSSAGLFGGGRGGRGCRGCGGAGRSSPGPAGVGRCGVAGRTPGARPAAGACAAA